MALKMVSRFLLVAALLLATHAMANTIQVFNIEICNESTLCSNGTNVGTVTVTENTGYLQFDLVFNKNTSGTIQYALGSQGGGDTLGLQIQNYTLTDLSVSNFSGAYYGGSLGLLNDADWSVDTGGTQLDGFGLWNLGINNPNTFTGQPADSLTELHFRLNGSGLTVANLTYNNDIGPPPDSHCVNANVNCYIAMHLNDIDTNSNNQNVATGYAGATLGATTQVPEPASLMLLGSGLGLLATRLRRRN